MKYQLYKDLLSDKDCGVIRDNNDGSFTSFLFDPANTDYANFKEEILADEAQLQDSEGVIMADAKDYVRTLP